MFGALILKLSNIKTEYKVVLAAVWDLEGTTVNVEKLHWDAHRKVAEALGVTLPDDMHEVMRLVPSFVGGPDRAVMEQIRKLAIKNNAAEKLLFDWTIEKMLDYKVSQFDSMFIEAKFKPRENVTRSMQMIESLGVPYCICSVTQSLQATEIIEKSGLLGSLSGRPILLRHHVEHGKPDPEVYLKAASEMNVAPDNLLVFEDSPTGIKAARAAGATVFAVPTLVNKEGKVDDELNRILIEAGASQVFGSWGEVIEFLTDNAYIYLEGVRNINNGLNVFEPNGELKGSFVKAFAAQVLLEGITLGNPESSENIISAGRPRNPEIL